MVADWNPAPEVLNLQSKSRGRESACLLVQFAITIPSSESSDLSVSCWRQDCDHSVVLAFPASLVHARIITSRDDVGLV